MKVISADVTLALCDDLRERNRSLFSSLLFLIVRGFLDPMFLMIICRQNNIDSQVPRSVVLGSGWEGE